MTAHRVSGEGSIVQRTDGRWQASLQVDKKRHVVYARTRSEVAKKLAVLQHQALASGQLANAGRRTVWDALAYYLETIGPSLKPTTLRDYTIVATLYVLPTLGDLPFTRLSPTRIQSLYHDLQERGLSRAPSKVHRLLHRLCKLAVLWGWLASNPCERVLSPKYQALRKELWTPFQLHVFLTGTREHRFHALWLLLLGTGLRIGEALALTWADVGKDTVRVSKTLTRVGGQWVTGTPKTRSGSRMVALPNEVISLLAPLRGEPDALVFAGKHGAPLHGADVEHALRQECDRLALPRMTPHQLRHMHASLLLRAGASITDVSARLGHSNPSITLSIYSHALAGGDQEVARLIGEAMNGDDSEIASLRQRIEGGRNNGRG